MTFVGKVTVDNIGRNFEFVRSYGGYDFYKDGDRNLYGTDDTKVFYVGAYSANLDISKLWPPAPLSMSFEIKDWAPVIFTNKPHTRSVVGDPRKVKNGDISSNKEKR
jgi:hypothetical protein